VSDLPVPVGTRPTVSRSQHDCPVAPPYRLDLTVSVLRRLSSNVVDVLTPDGQYARVLGEPDAPVVIRVAQVSPEMLTVSVDGDEREHHRALALARRVLGVERDLTHFDRAAARIPWLKGLASRMRGVRPPRYPTLWEACVNAIVFQQISLRAASAIMRRLVIALGSPLQSGGAHLYAFPTATRVMGVGDNVLQAAGLSRGKLATLRRVGEALARASSTRRRSRCGQVARPPASSGGSRGSVRGRPPSFFFVGSGASTCSPAMTPAWRATSCSLPGRRRSRSAGCFAR
jgi:hypothetical protein